MLTILSILLVLFLAGTNIKIISERLGHTNIKITMNRYFLVLNDMDKKASENIIKVLFK
ncbi:TPA: integrase [Clostridioides difficile]|uniref:integrase n=1 Tax=Clostridioides difficile TaxID=1496 RepID=UPI000C9A2AEF|nr:integrase [Clostridioides difficile]MCM0745396.1 integrase [Clostridioides difficile]